MPNAKYKMTLSLNVLNHLGLNLYSNVSAVLSEVVANAWDADADRVEIVIDADSQTISVTDDGIGMTPTDLNDRFLYVGFERRKAGASVTARGRAVMGRKGIGKLSLFAIADADLGPIDRYDEAVFGTDHTEPASEPAAER